MTGGGDCCGLNAVIRAAVMTAKKKYNVDCVGIQNGYRGMYLGESQFVPLNIEQVDDIIGDGGTILYNSNKDNLFRYPRRDKNGLIYGDDGKPVYDNVSQVAVDNIRRAGIDALIIVGGDGTLTSGRDYTRMGVKVMGVPKTIDNDLNSTDQTFGFDTAVSRNVEAVDCLKTTGRSHHRVMVFEVMGRDAGHVALHTGLASGADAIILPEIPYDIVKIKNRVKQALSSPRQYAIVIVAEGAPAPDGHAVTAIKQDFSPDGIKLGGVGKVIAQTLEAMLNAERNEQGFAINDVIMDVECRASALGHVQRGGTTIASDRILCTRYGSAAIDLLMAGNEKHMVALRDNKMVAVPLEVVIPSSDMHSNFKPVDPKGELVLLGKTMGVCFGD